MEDTIMVTVTDGAREYLHGAAGSLSDDECFRLARGMGGKIAIVTGRPVDSDVTFEHGESTVLAMEPQLAEDLEGRTIDIEERAQGKVGLVLV
jgi:hypothetical protein